MVWLLPDLPLPGFLWFNVMVQAGSLAAGIRIPGWHCPHRDPCRGDSDVRMAWRIPAEAITTVAQVSFMDVVCAAGQFIALASSTALAEATSVRSAAGALPWLARAERKWSAVMARSVGWSGAVLASFTQRRAARWQV